MKSLSFTLAFALSFALSFGGTADANDASEPIPAIIVWLAGEPLKRRRRRPGEKAAGRVGQQHAHSEESEESNVHWVTPS